MVPHVALELIEADPRWASMVTNVSTVATRSLQVWTATDETEMGWPHAGSTSAAYVPPFDTYASMSHLLETEGPQPDGPAAVSYFCSVLPETHADPATADAQVAETATTSSTGAPITSGRGCGRPTVGSGGGKVSHLHPGQRRPV